MTRQPATVRKKRIYAVVAVILAIILLCGIGCAVYVSDYCHAEEKTAQAMASDDHVTVSDAGDGVLLFLPDDPKAGLIFYPGGKMQYTAYAPLIRACAQRGILMCAPQNALEFGCAGRERDGRNHRTLSED